MPSRESQQDRNEQNNKIIKVERTAWSSNFLQTSKLKLSKNNSVTRDRGKAYACSDATGTWLPATT